MQAPRFASCSTRRTATKCNCLQCCRHLAIGLKSAVRQLLTPAALEYCIGTPPPRPSLLCTMLAIQCQALRRGVCHRPTFQHAIERAWSSAGFLVEHCRSTECFGCRSPLYSLERASLLPAEPHSPTVNRTGPENARKQSDGAGQSMIDLRPVCYHLLSLTAGGNSVKANPPTRSCFPLQSRLH